MGGEGGCQTETNHTMEIIRLETMPTLSFIWTQTSTWVDTI